MLFQSCCWCLALKLHLESRVRRFILLHFRKTTSIWKVFSARYMARVIFICMSWSTNMSLWKLRKVFFFFNFISCIQGPKPKLLPTVPLPCPGFCWWRVMSCGGTTVWTRPPHFMCSLVVICIGYSVLNGLRSYSAALFSAAYKIRPKYRDPAHAATADPAWVTHEFRASAESPVSRNYINVWSVTKARSYFVQC